MPSPEAERLLERLLAGELTLASPEVQSHMTADPDFAARAEALLDLAGELECGPVPAASGAEPWPGADQVMAAMVRERLGHRRERSWRWWLAAASAAALLVVAWCGTRERTPEAPPGTELAAGAAWPSGTVSRSSLSQQAWHWTGRAGGAGRGTYRVSVLGDDAAPLAEPVEVVDRTRWTPPAELLQRLPARFRWQVEARFPGEPKQVWSFAVEVVP